ncbi:MAG: DUF3783 domain-containing protein [Oscillospiraceae bacterium]|nr:DUF3783 domain-containing protein [Oscillospiraceae bacterium]
MEPVRYALPLRPQALLFNLRSDERTASIEDFLAAHGVSFRRASVSDQSEKLGALFSLPGFEKKETPSFQPGFTEELFVMAGFDNELLDAFIRFFREKGLRRIALKAVLTPYNAGWDARFLLKQLLSEQRAIDARRLKR